MASTIAPAYGFRAVVEQLVGGVVVGNTEVDYARMLAASGAASRVQALYDDAGIYLDATSGGLRRRRGSRHPSTPPRRRRVAP